MATVEHVCHECDEPIFPGDEHPYSVVLLDENNAEVHRVEIHFHAECINTTIDNLPDTITPRKRSE